MLWKIEAGHMSCNATFPKFMSETRKGGSCLAFCYWKVSHMDFSPPINRSRTKENYG